MKVRPVIAVLAGGLVWLFTFPLLAVLMVLVWPALSEAVQLYRSTGRYDVFGTSMLIAFQILWLPTNCASGLVTALISKRRAEVLILMGILVAYFSYNHFFVLWDQLPHWYNVLVVVLVAPMVVVGGMIPGFVRSRPKSDESVTVR